MPESEGSAKQTIPKDPLRELRGRAQRTLLLCGTVFGIALIWSVLPLLVRSPSTVTPATPANSARKSTSSPKAPRKSIDQAVFQASLWVPPPRPPEPPKQVVQPPPQPPPTLKLQLVAIRNSERADEGVKAVLFDPDASRVLTAAIGERIQRYTLKHIDNESVILEDAEFPGKPTHTLRLRSKVSLTPGSSGVGGGR